MRGLTNAKRPDLLVVGLGPAGSRAAARAAAGGLAVVAVERRAAPGQPAQCAELVPAMLDQELAGLESVTVQRIDGMLTHVEQAVPDAAPDFRGRMIDRPAFDAALAARAAAAGADCRYEVAVRRVGADGGVLLDDGSVLRPRVIVGADGPRSRVGRAIGRVNRALVETRQITVPMVRPQTETEIYLSAEIAGGYAWLFPKGRVANLGLGLVPAARRGLKPLLAARHARLVAEGRVGGEVLRRTGGLIPVGGMLEPAGRLGRVPVLLAGDAAGLANPVTGAGIAAAVQSGALAGEAVAAWLGGAPAALEDYAEELVFRFARSLARAAARRAEVLACYDAGGRPDAALLRRGWIAYPEYWGADTGAATAESPRVSACA